MNTEKLNRREFVKLISAGVAISTFTPAQGLVNLCKAAKQNRRPNIIFIMTDDLGYYDLGCYGQKLIKTPKIDKIAREGMKFTNCYSGAAVCAPARSVLMTGQHTGHTRVRNNSPMVGGQIEAFGEGSRRLSLKAEDVTVAQVLKKAGYATGITGKWGIAEPGTDGTPNKKGFDQWLGYLNQNHAPYYYTDYLWKNKEKMVIEENLGGKRNIYVHDLFTNFSVDFIRRHKDEPFFLYVPYTIPHRRYEVPSTDPYTDKDWPENAKIYAAMITRMDADVGRIMNQLKESAIDDNTLVFFCADNGCEKGRKKRQGWGDLFGSLGKFRGSKGSHYEGGLRVPMIARWPGKVPAGTTSDAVWYFADLMPTAAELAGAKCPESIDGISVLPAILDNNAKLNDRFLYWEIFDKGQINQVVRWKNVKAIRKGIKGKIELYDLAKDVSETTDIAQYHTDIVARIEKYLKTARTKSPNWPVKEE